MPTALTVHAIEESTYVITVSFTDEDGNPKTPTSVIWSLTDKNNNIINSREDKVAIIVAPATSVEIVLSGDDLAMQAGEWSGVKRILTVEAVYDSALGIGLPLKESAHFTLDNLVAVS